MVTLVGYKSGKQYCIKNIEKNEISGSNDFSYIVKYVEKFFSKNPNKIIDNNIDLTFVWEDNDGTQIFSSEIWGEIFEFLMDLKVKEIKNTIKNLAIK